MIRPAKCHFDGFIKAFIKGADKNHNPRKGTSKKKAAQSSHFPFVGRMLMIKLLFYLA